MLIMILSHLNSPDHATRKANAVTIHPPAAGLIGIRLLRNMPAAEATEPMEIVPDTNCATRTIHTAQCFGPGIRSNISIIPSPVDIVYLAPDIPIQNFRKIPKMIAHIIPEPSMAPVRVAIITSPDPIYSDAHTREGPINRSIPKPLGGTGMLDLLFIYQELNNY
jgi:hypothetical protein